MSKKQNEYTQVRCAVEQFAENCGIDSDIVNVRVTPHVAKRKQGIPLEFSFRVRVLVAPLQMIDGAWYVASVPSDLQDDLLFVKGEHCSGIGSYDLTVQSGLFKMHEVTLDNLTNVLETLAGDSGFQAKVDDLNNIEMEPAQIDPATLMNLASLAGGGAPKDTQGTVTSMTPEEDDAPSVTE